MRTASILLALVLVMGWAAEAAAQVGRTRDYTVTIGSQQFGLEEIEGSYCLLLFGPLAPIYVPYRATPILIVFGLIVVALIALIAIATMRWRRRAV
jgi:hypothetical protein